MTTLYGGWGLREIERSRDRETERELESLVTKSNRTSGDQTPGLRSCSQLSTGAVEGAPKGGR